MWMKAQLSVPVLNLDKFSVKQNWSQITIIVFWWQVGMLKSPVGVATPGSLQSKKLMRGIDVAECDVADCESV